MNPLRHLRPAVYTALTNPALELDGVPVPVRAYGAEPAGVYLLLNPDQDTSTKTRDGRACRDWACTLLVDVVSPNRADALSVVRADAVADLVSERLDGLRPYLPHGLQVVSASVAGVNGLTDFDGEQVDVHRYLRLRYTVRQEVGAAVLPPPSSGNTLPFRLA